MREFAFNLNLAESPGLTPNEELYLSNTLEQATNIYKEGNTFRFLNDIKQSLPEDFNIEFPYGQFFETTEGFYLFTKDKIFSVETFTDPWTLIEEDVFDFKSDSLTTITPGNRWHFSNAGDSWFAYNGQSVVFKEKNLDSFSEDRIKVNNDITINTGTFFKGRFIMGGFNSDDLWSEEWQSLFEIWSREINDTIDYDFNNIKQNFVFWSSVGGGDFPLWFFYPDKSLKGNASIELLNFSDMQFSKSLFIEKLRENELGFMPMDTIGEVLSIKPLGDNLIVYTEDAVYSMSMISSPVSDIPSTFSKTKISSLGVLSRDHICDSLSQHFYISQSGDLMNITGEGQIQNLDYNHVIKPHLGESVSCSFDDRRNRFFISFTNFTLIITSEGITDSDVQIFDVTNRKSNMEWIVNKEPREVVIKTAPFNIAEVSSKTMTGGEIATDTDGKVECSFLYRDTLRDNFVEVMPVPINNLGYFMLRVNGTAFKFKIKIEALSRLSLSNIRLNYQIPDRRFRRARNVNQINS